MRESQTERNADVRQPLRVLAERDRRHTLFGRRKAERVVEAVVGNASPHMTDAELLVRGDGGRIDDRGSGLLLGAGRR